MKRYLVASIAAVLLLSGCNSSTGPQTYDMPARDVRTQIRSLSPGSVLQNAEIRTELVSVSPEAIKWRVRHEEGPEMATLTAHIEALGDNETRLNVTADRPTDPRSRDFAEQLPSYGKLLNALVAATTEQIDAKLENREFNPRAVALTGVVAAASLAQDEQSGAADRARAAAEAASADYEAEAEFAEDGGWGEPN